MSPAGLGAPHRFGLNDRVLVKVANSAGNPRTPPYARGKTGVVVTLHGTMENPLDHREVYPPLCTVAIDVSEVFGHASSDQIWVDIHEDWLEAE